MIGLLVSYAFVGAVLAFSSLLEKHTTLGDEGARKIIHIGVSHWILLAVVLFDSPLLASVVPASFIVLNYLSYRFQLLSAMEREGHDPEDLGTVYYAVSLTIITYLSFRYDLHAAGVVAILAMGWGDGMGAVLGKRFSRQKLYRMKTYIGSLTMLLFTFVIAYVILGAGMPITLVIALAATAIELITPKGFDNLTVPLFLYFSVVLFLA